MKLYKSYIQTAALSLACLAAVYTQAQNTAGANTATPSNKQRQEPPLKVGSPAPPIVAAKWIKGTPVTKFERGRIYVVEFWATWCGPCRASMPHLSEIARTYRDKATVVSFDVNELVAGKDKNADYIAKVERFVKRLGDGMDYIVAADVRENTMWNTWLVASGQYGIPASFIIDRDGTIAWKGHPGMVEAPLKMVIDGTYDDAARQKMATQMKENRDKVAALNTTLADAEKAGDYPKAVQAADEIISISPLSTGAMVKKKYEILARTDAKAAHAYGETILKKYAADPLTVQAVAMFIADSKAKNGQKPDYALAVRMMEQAASRCDSEDPFTTSNLAKAYYKNGDKANAVKTQQKVLDLLNDERLVSQKQEVKEEAQKNMEIYQGRAQDAVIIKGQVSGDTKGFNKIYYYSGGSAVDSAVITNGQFSISLPFSKPYTQLFYTEYEVKGGNGAMRGYRPFPVLLDRPATINISMDIQKGFYGSELSGSPTAALFAGFLQQQNVVYRKISEEMQKLYPSSNSAVMRSSHGADDKSSTSRDSLTKIYMGGMIEQFVKEHPDAFVSTYVLDGAAKSSMTVTQMQSAYESLSSTARQSPEGQKVAAYIRGLQNAVIGKQASSFVLTTAEGQSFSFQQLKGKYVWVDFWASWCGPCKAAFPKMRELYAKYKNKNFEIVGVSTDETKEPWLKAVNQFKNPWPQVWDNKTVANEFAVAAYPTGFLIDPNGKIIIKEVGFDPKSEDGIAKKLDEIFSK